MLSNCLEEPGKVTSLDLFDKVIFILRLLISLFIFWNSTDFDGCIKLINRKEKNIIFFEIPENNLKL